jgi:hypothetical protein
MLLVAKPRRVWKCRVVHRPVSSVAALIHSITRMRGSWLLRLRGTADVSLEQIVNPSREVCQLIDRRLIADVYTSASLDTDCFTSPVSSQG